MKVNGLSPYDAKADLVPLDADGWGRRQWPFRAVLCGVMGFAGETKADSGEPWWSWYRWVAQRYRTPLTITFAFVATHNHFVFDRGGKVFNRSAPVIKLRESATEDEYLALLGVLNSSLACFWLKQNSQAKAGTSNTSGGGDRWSPEPWFERYEFTGSTLQDYPLPTRLPMQRGQALDQLAKERAAHSPAAIAAADFPTAASFEAGRVATEQFSARMIAVQEELDWETYWLYGLIDEDLTYAGNDLPMLALGERAFEIVLALAAEAGGEETAWFTRHGSKPITEIPAYWPTAYRQLVQRRLDVIASNASIRLLERPEHKRRWATEPWENRQEDQGVTAPEEAVRPPIHWELPDRLVEDVDDGLQPFVTAGRQCGVDRVGATGL